MVPQRCLIVRKLQLTEAPCDEISTPLGVPFILLAMVLSKYTSHVKFYFNAFEKY